jgi:hypothetical protein
MSSEDPAKNGEMVQDRRTDNQRSAQPETSGVQAALTC